MKIVFLCLIWLSCAAGSVRAEQSAIGYVKTVADATVIVEGDLQIPAVLGSPIRVGQVIKTDERGAAGITLKDNTVLSIGPNTELEIKAYQFEPQQERLELNASLLKGTLQYISGVIAKLKPEAVTLKTPSGVIAVRGTRFLAKVDP
ncbi:FecR family protein [Methylomonas sp. MED-D]|uniref:FecR protein domain-containing protein n=1 Tax=Methylomonas koyamae TaxID=702114 RepID=A0A177NS37_9GAMM|nr:MULTISPECIES: FecR domain-containing protein [Methylomonas]NJA05065.1 hypothetical protein [Methylococcaceae bacterium WWC4]MDT4331739.1 FecR domain-containing protein [Methylomonas sp. MV1]OAI20866.1 hypothetical protein A1355_23700 [Methylomonas koyamae]OHX36920.1 hypothetical protein BJL95_19665 [Methylomonas sp. LWB]WGS84124.1 FecR domain-containing protein [Methylomonas sp. UP202]